MDTSRVYAAGYSAGGETMSRAVAIRPETCMPPYLHGASQWDGSYHPLRKIVWRLYLLRPTATSITAAAGPAHLRKISTKPFENAGWSDADIDRVLRIETPDNAFFNEKGHL